MRGLHETSVVVGAMTIALLGCSREPQQTTRAPAANASPPVASVEEPAAASEPPAESGLSIKRGVAMLGQDRATFRPCDENVELWLLDQTDGLLMQTFAAEMRNGPAKVYIEAYGERAPVAEDIPAAKAYAGTFALEEVLYAGMQAEVQGCDQPPPTYIVAARGSEPFWAVEVGETQMIWSQQVAPTQIDLGAPQTQDSEGAARYTASARGHQVDLMIDAQACRDPMSGEFFAYAAKAVFDGKEFSGCARVGK